MEQTALFRILDANLDRAREGMRVIEEWCRFGLERSDLTEECKALRQGLAHWHHPQLRACRNTPTDPGTHLTHPQEAQRSDLDQVLQANFCRVQESLRVLEEYGKLYDHQMVAAVKQMRYQIYTLESTLMVGQGAAQLRERMAQACLYLVTSPHPKLAEVVEAALRGGVQVVQYRDKQADAQMRLSQAQQLKHLCQEYGALFIVNDYLDLALAVDADGVHLGQQDYPMPVARQLLGATKLVGRSTTNPTELQRAIAEGADYIGVGPVYETPTKAGKAAAGLEYVRYALAHAPMPWFAIGGIDQTNLDAVVAAGARRVAVVRAVMQAEDPQQTTEQLRAKLV
jgi:thiamine-phosphate pyrophosphorylase